MIYLIRHGEPAASFSAHPNPGLSELGARQAAEAAEAVATLGAKRAIVSPLQRCRETAAPYEKLMETHARIEAGVGEIITPPGIEDRGVWIRSIMGGKWSDLGPEFDAWRKGTLAAVEKLQDETAVFSHFVAINAIVGLLTGDDRVVIFKPGHCSITKLTRRSGKLAVLELGSEAATVVT
ncbi:MAG TPA: histidine phosphatase family protein [Hyphomonadaceae bacterium]|jgi:broad specificity phosphatase PhoE|nr:histidine phosphatase family protein [Hyphomonadaceae bacterium]